MRWHGSTRIAVVRFGVRWLDTAFFSFLTAARTAKKRKRYRANAVHITTFITRRSRFRRHGLNGADVLVARLFHHGVRTVFGMPGSHSTALYDAIQRHGRLRTILVRNEQAGAFMADGYARVTGRPGVLCTTAGPGATNALTGIAEAWADSMPVLLLAGQVNADRMHQECGAYHEIDLE